ncbi:hypothetical protein Poli38472_007453 [Pythium oligandrum]|uniref:WD repeat-containing protein 76 n=1 Tax=Pythium oligandrum TaxID=41045 RepID=A0A8K1CSD2_PYTOL|nr:hypothetical protein Poli38472_007453 [Pythium oligandrum]|eukprot:TMW67781.1 hypothetical protein Poli38472_007453 [Pythium oligandrum]
MRRTRAQTHAHRAAVPQATEKSSTRATRGRAAVSEPAVKQEEHEPSDSPSEEEEEEQTTSDGMTEYERKRLENIQRNLEFMRSMGVSTAKIAARTAASAVQHKPPHSTLPKKRKDVAAAGPQRKSQRLQGKTADLMLPPEWNDRDMMTSRSQFAVEHVNADPDRFDANLDAEALNLDGEQGKHLLQSMILKQEREEATKVDATGIDGLVDYELTEHDVVKAVQERVYSMAFHPRSDRAVVATGDKRGNLSLWTPDAPDAANNAVVMYRPHTLPITQLHFAANDQTKLLSTSFDSSAREFDLQAAKFTEWFATPDGAGLTSLALTAQPTNWLASADDGKVWVLDRRLESTKQSHYALHEKKVNTVHQHPLSEFCFATASLDRTVCLWDSRQLKKATPLLTMPHSRSVNCAYFSPNGHHLVTVGQDNYNHVYDTRDASHHSTQDVKPTLRISHNNQTGRWLTKLHAAWDPKRPDHYVIGCMEQPRRVQIFHATRKSPIQELTSEWFASVHSINVFHPMRDWIAGGNSSGRLCLWRPVSTNDVKVKREA